MAARRKKLKQAVWVLLLTCACAKYTQVPPADYANLEEKPGHGYRVRTTDGHVYVARLLTVDNGDVVIRELSSKTPGPAAELPAVPFTIARDSVASIERNRDGYGWLRRSGARGGRGRVRPQQDDR